MIDLIFEDEKDDRIYNKTIDSRDWRKENYRKTRIGEEF